MTADETAAAPAPEVAAAAAAPTVHPIHFHARTGEYFRIWIVNTVLTILTAGIYSAWAKVRTTRYLYASTEVDGGRFDYHASPQTILRSRAIAAVLLGLYVGAGYFAPLAANLVFLLLVLATPVLLVWARRFALRNTSYRNVRFSFGGEAGEAARILLGYGLLSVITLGLAYPYARWLRYRFLVDGSWWGNQSLRTTVGARSFYGAYLVAGLLGLLGFLVAMAAVGFVGWQLAGEAGASEDPELAMPQWLLITLVIGFYLLLVPAWGWLQAALLRRVLDTTSVGKHRLRASFSPAREAWILTTNLLAIAASLGLLIPWAKLRLYRYRLAHLEVETEGSLADAAVRMGDDPSATGEEIGEFFDFDFGL